MRLHDVLEHAPAEVFDFIMEAEGAGYIPSADDFEQEFGEAYNVQHWAEKLGLPECRQELEGEYEDESFGMMTPEQELKDRGMKLADFY